MDESRRLVEILAAHRARYDRAVDQQARALAGEGVFPLMLMGELTAQQQAYPRFNLKEIHDDPQKMLANGLVEALTAMNGGREAVPSLRANMGCGIVASLFGVMPLLFEDRMPWVVDHLPKARIMEMRPEDIAVTPEFRQGLAHMEYIADALKGSGVRVYPMDIQGVFDTAHIVFGEDIFYEVYDDPDFVHHLLELSLAATNLAFDECLVRMPGSDETVAHYNHLALPRRLGGIKLSEDTSTLLSREHIAEYVVPYMHRALEHAGGGYIHYCGQNAHLLEAVLAEPLAHGLNFGNPEKHDMADVLERLAACGKFYFGGAPRGEEEPWQAFFERMLRPAYRDGQARLFLQRSVPAEDAGAVSAAWEAACAAVARG